MIANLLAAVVMTAALETSSTVYECVNDKGETYTREGGCKVGDKLSSRINITGTPMVQMAPRVPMAPQVPTARPTSKPQSVPVK